jgi:hypothetical protein
MKKEKILILLFILSVLVNPSLVLAGPSSTNYRLDEYGFGAGGTASSSSEGYSMFGTVGETSEASMSSESFVIGGGLEGTMQASVPPAPSITNPEDYYNKLKLVINTGNNPTDAEFAIAISEDSFGTDTRFVQHDHTVSTTLNEDDWQTYAEWGGASGFLIIGLSPNKTYSVRVAARQGSYTQTQYGPLASAQTISPTLSYAIRIGPTYPGTPTAPPYSISLGSLTPGSVVTTTNKVWIDFETNGTAGGAIYLHDNNGGLLSSQTGYTINSVTNNLASLLEGYGAQGTDVSETTGGPMTIASPYDGSSNTVGMIDTQKRIIFDSSNQPVAGGRAAFVLKAKSSSTAPASTDYADILTVLVSASF